MKEELYAIHYKDDLFLRVEWDRDYGNIMSVEKINHYTLSYLVYENYLEAEGDLKELSENKGSLYSYGTPKEIVKELKIVKLEINTEFKLEEL